MKKLAYVLLLFAFVLISCEKDEPERSSGRTLLVYMIASNNLESDIAKNINAMLKGLPSVGKACNLIVYWDGCTGNPKLSRYTVDEKGTVSNENIQREYGNQNSASPEVMKMVFRDMFKLNPSESYGLIMSSHGTGWLPADVSTKFKSFGQDDGKVMEIPDLAAALTEVIYQPFDYILFDACLMSSVEVAYELRNAADYIIASPAEVLSEGFPFNILMPYLYSDKVSDYTIKLPEAFIDYYNNYYYYGNYAGWGTIATVKCSEMEALALQVKDLLMAHSDGLQHIDVTKLQRYDRTNLGFIYSTCDLKHFISTLSFPETPDSFLEQLDKTVIFKDFVHNNLLFKITEETYSGIGIYIPQADKPKWNAYLPNMAWYEAAGWEQVGW